MQKFLTSISRETLRVVLTGLAIFLVGTASAFAASNISTNIQTDGNLSVTGTSAQTGVATFGNNVLIGSGNTLDVSSAGALYVGTSTATSIVIGKAGVTTTINGTLSVGAPTFTVPAGGSFDTASAGALYLGTSTANAITIGKAGVTTTVSGALTTAGILSVPAAGSLDTSAAGALYIGTSTANAITIGKAGVTTSAPGLTTLTNASTTQVSIGGSTGTTLNVVQKGNCSLVSVSATATSTTYTTCTGAGSVDNTYTVILQATSSLPAGLVIDAASTTATAGTFSVRINNVDGGAAVTTGTPGITFWAFK